MCGCYHPGTNGNQKPEFFQSCCLPSLSNYQVGSLECNCMCDRSTHWNSHFLNFASHWPSIRVAQTLNPFTWHCEDLFSYHPALCFWAWWLVARVSWVGVSWWSSLGKKRCKHMKDGFCQLMKGCLGLSYNKDQRIRHYSSFVPVQYVILQTRQRFFPPVFKISFHWKVYDDSSHSSSFVDGLVLNSAIFLASISFLEWDLCCCFLLHVVLSKLLR
jgi:hypothetical protein